ncbi:hypothetical protein Bca52824_042053 [Brassica carinata]|uniref:Uncharacterized protein n=1 Tax=Brassica carinata TaxID=52824 RepID=A0A8X7RUG4_BRACI|nr:hypothetical protein Bca52824_042053 [Brassica carinata]
MRCVLLGGQFREEAEENVEDEGRETSGSEAPSQVARSRRRTQRRGQIDQSASCPSPRSVPFDELDCRPIVYHPGGIFEELPPLPREVLRDPQVQSWGNVFSSCSSSETVKRLLRESGGAGVTFLIPSAEQRPWSPPVGYQCVYESYFQDQTKLWFPIPRLITSYAFRRDIAISQLLNGSLRIAVMLMVMAAEMDISMSVRVFEELTFTKAEPNGIFSVKMRANYNVLTGHPNKTQDWQRAYFYVKSDEHAFEEPPGDDYRVLWNPLLVRHPNTIAYPENFFENAQLIAAHSHLRWRTLARVRALFSSRSYEPLEFLYWVFFSFAVDWESRLPCVLGTFINPSRYLQEQQNFLTKPRDGGNPALEGKGYQKQETEPEEQPSTLERNVPLEMAPSSADASEVCEETFMEPAGTSAAMGSDDMGRLDPIDSTRGSSEGCPKKKTRRTAAGDEGRCDGTPVPEGPSKSGGSQDGSPSRKEPLLLREKDGESGGSLPQMSGRGFPDRLTRQIRGGDEGVAADDLYFKKEYIDAAVASKRKLKSDRLAKKEALRESFASGWSLLLREKAELEEERGAVVETLIKERKRLRNSRVQEVTRERIKVQTAMADKSTRCVDKMKDSGTEIPQSMIDIFSEQEKVHEAEVAKLHLEPFSEDDFALSPLNLPSRFLITSREATGDPVDEPMIDITSAPEQVVAGTYQRDGPDLSASDPPAQVEDLDAQAVEEETAEPLAPSRDDQDIVV